MDGMIATKFYEPFFLLHSIIYFFSLVFGLEFVVLDGGDTSC